MHSTMRQQAGLVVFALTAGLGCAAAAKAPLTRVLDVRQLGQKEAGARVPVRLQGVVTALSGYGNSFFLQDATAGISVDRTDRADVHVGDEVEIRGTSGAGLFAPTAQASVVSVLGSGSLPAPPRVTYGDMFGGAQDSQWIEVEGVVHSARLEKVFEHDALILNLEMGGGAVRVILQDFADLQYERFIDATMRLRGVASTSFNQKRQFVGLGMFVPDKRDAVVVQPSMADPFAAPAIPVRDALQFGQGQHRMKVAGVVTYQVPGHTLYVQDGNDGIRIESTSTGLVKPGERVEVVGFPVMGEYSPILKDSVFRVTGTGDPVWPRHVDAKDVIGQVSGFDSAPYDQQLVQLQGRVVESRRQGGQRAWLLRQGNAIFDAQLPLAGQTDRLSDLGSGSILSLTGICTVQTNSDRRPISFGILLRSEQDVVVLKQAPWWTPSRTLGVLVALAGAVILGVVWVVVLRKRVEQQTRIIRESEKSFRYLAEHDGLTGLLNRVAILSILDREVERARLMKTGVTIVLCDLDHFKCVNDSRGHLAGDAALCRFATALATNVRVDDYVGRYGGEEFLVVLTGIFAPQVQERLAVLHSRISNLTVFHQQTEFKITCSLGATFIPAGQLGVEVNLALAATDHALYQAKKSGRDCVVFQPLSREIA